MKIIFLLLFLLASITVSGQFAPEFNLTPGIDDNQSNFAADMDNDGDIDLVSTKGNENKIVWFENYGGGVFSIYIIYIIAGKARGITNTHIAL